MIIRKEPNGEPLTSTQLNGYQWSLDWMANIDPYSGLIVSMHRDGALEGSPRAMEVMRCSGSS